VFTRRGKYVVRRLPAGTVVGSATTLLDAADLAMEDARRGPGKYVIEQPIIEVDVSKAYGVLALSAADAEPPDVPEILNFEAGITTATVECLGVSGATGYQWFLGGVPHSVTVDPVVYLAGLESSTLYVVQVAALRGGQSSAVSESVSFTTLGLAPPVWQVVPVQLLTVGVSFDLDLAVYASSPGGDTPSFSLVSGALPAGLSIVGTRITGTPTTVETQTPVIRATAAGGTADSAAVVFESLNADVTAPAAPTGFTAAGYSASQVRLTWTNPADDATVAGERKSGFLGVDVYRDGVKIDRVLASAAAPEEYLAETTVTALWKVRSVDAAFNKGPFTAELSAGPLAQTTAPGVPVSVAATRDSSTSATVTWAAGSGPAPTSYQVWMSLSLNGTYTQVGSPTGTSHTQTSGDDGISFTGSQTPYFYVVAVRNGELSAASQIAAALLGSVTSLWQESFDTPTLSSVVDIWSPTGHDAYDPAIDNPCETSSVRARYSVGDSDDPDTSPVVHDGIARSMRVQLTVHDYGTNNWPNDNAHTLPNAGWHYKNGAPHNDNVAHRNEVKTSGVHPMCRIYNDIDYWLGWSMFFPGPNDPNGDAETKPLAFFGGHVTGPQLHPVNATAAQRALVPSGFPAISPDGGFNPVIAFQMLADKRMQGSSLQPYSEVPGAPVVRYARGSDTLGLPKLGGAPFLYVYWDPVPGATRYRLEWSVRPEGPFEPRAEIAASSTDGIRYDQIAVTFVPNDPRSYVERYLGANGSKIPKGSYIRISALVNGAWGPWSLLCPARRSCIGSQIYGVGYDGQPIERSNAIYEARDFSGIEGWDYRGRWTDFVLRYRLNQNGLGAFQFWVNDVEKARAFNFNFGRGEAFEIPGGSYGQAVVHYWRWGNYHGRLPSPWLMSGETTETEGHGQRVPADWPARQVIYYDEFHLASMGSVSGQLTPIDDIQTSLGYQTVKPRGVRT